MKLAETLEKLALEFAAKNAIVKHGEIVETVWGDWKRPHKVKIYSIGAALSLHHWKNINGQKDYSTEKACHPRFGMTYCALRLFADGRAKDKVGSGIVLRNFKTANGTIWEETEEVINHCAYSWELPKSHKGLKSG